MSEADNLGLGIKYGEFQELMDVQRPISWQLQEDDDEVQTRTEPLKVGGWDG